MQEERTPESTPDPIDIAVGERVRQRRLQIRMSQGRVAQALGLTYQQVQKYETGANRMAASTLVRIAAVLDTTVADLFEGIGPEISKAPPLPHQRAVTGLAEELSAIPQAAVRRALRILVRALYRDQMGQNEPTEPKGGACRRQRGDA